MSGSTLAATTTFTAARRPAPPASSSAAIRGLVWTVRAVTIMVTTTASVIVFGPDIDT
jgi:hypothetical protein